MIAAVGFSCILIFAAVFTIFDVVGTAGKSLILLRETVKAAAASGVDDIRREVILRKASVGLIRVLLSIMLKSALCVAVSAIPVFLFQAGGMVQAADVGAFLARLEVLAGATILMAIVHTAWHRLCRSR